MAAVKVKAASELVTPPAGLLTTTEYRPTSADWTLLRV